MTNTVHLSVFIPISTNKGWEAFFNSIISIDTSSKSISATLIYFQNLIYLRLSFQNSFFKKLPNFTPLGFFMRWWWNLTLDNKRKDVFILFDMFFPIFTRFWNPKLIFIKKSVRQRFSVNMLILGVISQPLNNEKRMFWLYHFINWTFWVGVFVLLAFSKTSVISKI